MGRGEDIKNGVKRVLDRIRNNPTLDAALHSGLPTIPFVGNFLLALYNKYDGPKDEKNCQIIKLLKNFQSMNNENLEQLSNQLENNKQEIYKNRDFLKIITNDTTQILTHMKNLERQNQLNTYDIKLDVNRMHLELVGIHEEMDQVNTTVIRISQQVDELTNLVGQALQSNETREVTKIKETVTIVPYDVNSFSDDSQISSAIKSATALLANEKLSLRTFQMIKRSMPNFDTKELRKILVYAGGVRFQRASDNKEFWGLVEKNLIKLGFSSTTDSSQILHKVSQNPKDNPKQLAKLLLSRPDFKLRTFESIKQKIGGFSDDELRGILNDIGAFALVGTRTNKEYWGLLERFHR